MEQNTTIRKQEQQLLTQNSVEDNHKENSTLADMEKIEGTPFTLINDRIDYDPLIDEGNKWFMVMGNYKITENTETKLEQIEKLETEKWNIIITMITIAIKKLTENPEIYEM